MKFELLSNANYLERDKKCTRKNTRNITMYSEREIERVIWENCVSCSKYSVQICILCVWSGQIRNIHTQIYCILNIFVWHMSKISMVTEFEFLVLFSSRLFTCNVCVCVWWWWFMKMKMKMLWNSFFERNIENGRLKNEWIARANKWNYTRPSPWWRW